MSILEPVVTLKPRPMTEVEYGQAWRRMRQVERRANSSEEQANANFRNRTIAGMQSTLPKRALEYINANPGCVAEDIRASLGVIKSTAQRIAKALTEERHARRRFVDNKYRYYPMKTPSKIEIKDARPRWVMPDGQAKPVKPGETKLTREIAHTVKKMIRAGYQHKEIGARFGVSKSTVTRWKKKFVQEGSL